MAQILQLDSTGQPVKWISWQQAVTYHAKNLVAWEMGEIKNTYHGGHNCQGEQSIVVTSTIMAIKGKPKRKYKIPTLTNQILFRRDHHMCAYCGGVYTDSKLSRDHIIPQSRGGRDTWTNCVTSCDKCNQRKDDKTPQEAHMELLYVPYVPTSAEYLILKGRHVLADQMAFLLTFVPENSPLRKRNLM